MIRYPTGTRGRYCFLLMWGAVFASLPGQTDAQHPIRFEVRVLCVDANEGCDIADIDGDGRLDIVAGRNWYQNDGWVPRPLRLIEDRGGYVRSNGEWAFDVDQDGDPDVLSIDFFDGHLYWYENVGGTDLLQGMLWPKHLLADTGLSANEASFLIDLDRDGTPEWVSDQWVPTNPLVAWRFHRADPTGGKERPPIEMKPYRVGESTGHGFGVGDVNNDGRDDILVGTGWYECPPDRSLESPWKFHPAWNRQAPCPMIVTDVDGDGINDVLMSQAHGFGLYMWRGRGNSEDGEPQFDEVLVDDSFSQAHCLHWADLDGDDQPELITGKRVRAHNGKDPGGMEPPVMKYYVWNKQRQQFSDYLINRGDVGTGLQIRTADLDGDGDVDIVVAGKEGTQILFSRLVQ
ncbi:MAG: hypothetical protein KatS3mg111_4112 [Pirellulaceae bacterium]|nr:MAG: hypothetical protein KatS3mg111_4112 [Pirellulaceae bacterium]